MRILTLMALMLIAPLTLGIEWCNEKGECITQEPGYKLVLVPWYWKVPNIVEFEKGAKNIVKDGTEPVEDCDKLGVSPSVCKPD